MTAAKAAEPAAAIGETWGLCSRCRHTRPVDHGGLTRPHNRFVSVEHPEPGGLPLDAVRCEGGGQPPASVDVLFLDEDEDDEDGDG